MTDVRRPNGMHVALMTGDGPLGRSPRGTPNYTIEGPPHSLYLEPTAIRYRIEIAGRVVADTQDAALLHETGLFPVLYVPRADVDADVLVASDTSTHCPFKGDASYLGVQVGDDLRPDAIWTYPSPLPGAPPIADLVAFDPEQVDAWYEEGVRMTGHLRDPYHRVDAIPSDRHVTVRLGTEVVADTRRAVLVAETGYPVRTYIPAADVRTDLLGPSDTVTHCPYKGTTSRYHAIRSADVEVEDAVWVYDEPRPEVAAIAGLLGFYDEKVTIEHAVERFTAPTDR